MFVLLVLLATLSPIGHVNDFAHILKPETVTTLEKALTDFQTKTGAEIAVVTIDSHGQDETIETYAEKLFQKWGIGKEKEDNGVLILVSRDDREVRIEVGYGLEPTVTDISSGRIIRDIIVSKFQEGDYDQGIADGVGAITTLVSGEALPEPVQNKFDESKIIWIIFIVIYLIIIYKNRNRKGGPPFIFLGGLGGGSGRSSGGFGGFGGGSSGGGGASGKW